MKFLFDIFPVALFFAAYAYTKNIFWATKFAMLASVIQVVFSLLRHKKVPLMLGISAGLVITLGCVTLYSHDKHIIMWKPSIFFWIVAISLLIGDLLKKTPLRLSLEKHLNLPDKIWRRANFACAMFFILLGVLNIYVAYHFSEKTWVYFKMFGVTGLNFVFLLILFMFLSKFHTEEAKEKTQEI